MMNLAPAAGWYPDPSDASTSRWWDGAAWTQHVQPAQATAVAQARPLQVAGLGGASMSGTPVPVAPGAAAEAAPVAAAAWGGTGSESFRREPTTSRLAIAALVCAFIAPVLGVVFGIVALVKIKKAPAHAALKGRGLAMAGIVISALSVVVLVIIMAVAIPTFLAQKGAAFAARAKSNIVQTANALEECGAAARSYAGCDQTLRKDPNIGPQLSAGCTGTASGVCLALIGTTGYEIRSASTANDGTLVTFSAKQAEDGTRTLACAPVQQQVCPAGTWSP